jgi:hypothetical protein
MEEMLKSVSDMIDEAEKIPRDIKEIVKFICKGYVRESGGKIPLSGVKNVCNTTFNSLSEDDKEFSGKDKIFADTETDYDKDCNIIHTVNYLNDSNYIKLIAILTHELGHVMTESKPCQISEKGIYGFAKRTSTYYFNSFYDEEGTLKTQSINGFRISDGFLESICTKIWESREFRTELLQAGYDLKDYIYKDERIFPSRIYDEYKACFELFDYIMDGSLFEFSCKTFSNNQELCDFINQKKLNVIYGCLDQSNDAIWNLKKYEGQHADEIFDEYLKDYIEKKKNSIYLSSLLMEMYGKSGDDKKYQELVDVYNDILQKQKLLPLSEEYKIKK